MQLSENEYIWAVTYTSRDDGHRCTAAYFTDQREADSFCRDRAYGDNQRVVQMTLWSDSEGNFYEVRYMPINVDEHVHRREALKKLSDAEKRAIGVSR